MWKEFFPISMPSVAISLLSFCDMTCSLSSVPLASILAGRAGARPDHPISCQSAANFAVVHNGPHDVVAYGRRPKTGLGVASGPVCRATRGRTHGCTDQAYD